MKTEKSKFRKPEVQDEDAVDSFQRLRGSTFPCFSLLPFGVCLQSSVKPFVSLSTGTISSFLTLPNALCIALFLLKFTYRSVPVLNWQSWISLSFFIGACLHFAHVHDTSEFFCHLSLPTLPVPSNSYSFLICKSSIFSLLNLFFS